MHIITLLAENSKIVIFPFHGSLSQEREIFVEKAVCFIICHTFIHNHSLSNETSDHAPCDEKDLHYMSHE